MKLIFPRNVEKIIEILQRRGKCAYAVGGCIRDICLCKEPSDWDITTSATPEEMIQIFGEEKIRTLPTGLKHGTVSVLLDGETHECTTYRIEKGYSDSRHPDAVECTSSLRDDLCRRDFTINAMACRPGEGIVDLFGGMDDLKNQIVRCVGDPEKRFAEDALRILRAVRFATVLNFGIESETSKAICTCAEGLCHVSAERKSAELRKILMSDYPERGLEMLFDFGLSDFILPGLKKTCRSISQLPKSFSLRLAAACLNCADIDLSPLKLSGSEVIQTKKLLQNTDFTSYYGANGEDIDYNARKILSIYGSLSVQVCLLYGCFELADEVEAQRRTGACVTISALAIDGNNLKEVGIAPACIGKCLNRLLEVVLKNPEKNTREKLLYEAKKFNKQRFCLKKV